MLKRQCQTLHHPQTTLFPSPGRRAKLLTVGCLVKILTPYSRWVDICPHTIFPDCVFRILSGILRNMSCHSCWFRTMNLPKKTFLQPILTRMAESLPTKHCESTIQHMTFRGVQMLLTSVHDLISWLPLLKGITLTLTNMAGSLASSQSLSTTEV